MGIWCNKKRILSVIHLLVFLFFSSSEKRFTVDIFPGPWVSAKIGESVILKCVVDDCDSPTFSWRTQTDNSPVGEVRSEGAKSELIIEYVSFEDEDTYLVTVTCARRKLEKRIHVEVYCKWFSKLVTLWLLPFPGLPLECDFAVTAIYVETGLAL